METRVESGEKLTDRVCVFTLNLLNVGKDNEHNLEHIK